MPAATALAVRRPLKAWEAATPAILQVSCDSAFVAVAFASLYMVEPAIPRVTFSSARNRYFSEQVCDEVFS